MDNLNINLVKEMSNLNPMEVPIQILIGLKDLVKSQVSHSTKMMKDLFEIFFPRWITEIKLQYFKVTGNSKSDDNSDHICAILELLTYSLRDD